MPMETENTNERRKGRKGSSLIKLALFLFIFVLVIGVAVYAFLDINPINVFTEGYNELYSKIVLKSKAELTEKVRNIGTYENSEYFSAATVSNNFVIAEKSSVRIIDMYGNEKAYIPVSLNKPHIHSYKQRAIIADLEGSFLALLDDGKILWQKSLNEDIVYASISENWILLITNSKEAGYKRSIRAWSLDGQEVSIRNISNYYPVSVSHYPTFEKATFVVNGVDISGLETNSFFDFLDPAMAQKASIRGDNEVMAKGMPAGDKLFLYGEKSIFLIDNMFNTVWKKKTADSLITAASVIDGKYPVYAERDTEIYSRENRNVTNVRILNQDSSVKKELIVDDVVTGIISSGKTAALISGHEILFINSNGEIMDTYTSKMNISGVYLANEKMAYIVSGGTITRFNINVSHKKFGIF